MPLTDCRNNKLRLLVFVRVVDWDFPLSCVLLSKNLVYHFEIYRYIQYIPVALRCVSTLGRTANANE